MRPSDVILWNAVAMYRDCNSIIMVGCFGTPCQLLCTIVYIVYGCIVGAFILVVCGARVGVCGGGIQAADSVVLGCVVLASHFDF